jgi:hypothetical protein
VPSSAHRKDGRPKFRQISSRCAISPRPLTVETISNRITPMTMAMADVKERTHSGGVLLDHVLRADLMLLSPRCRPT